MATVILQAIKYKVEWTASKCFKIEEPFVTAFQDGAYNNSRWTYSKLQNEPDIDSAKFNKIHINIILTKSFTLTYISKVAKYSFYGEYIIILYNPTFRQ